MNNSELFKLKAKDFLVGLAVAVGAAALTWLGAALNAPGFHFVDLDTAELIRIILATGVAYLTKAFFSDEEGKVFGKV